MALITETNTPTVYRRVLRVAHLRFGLRTRLQADFEHGQWWITLLDSGAQYSVVDCQTQDGFEYLDFEQVSEGEEG